MSGLLQSVRQVARDYGAAFGMTRAELIGELVNGAGILIAVWVVSTLAAVAVQS